MTRYQGLILIINPAIIGLCPYQFIKAVIVQASVFREVIETRVAQNKIPAVDHDLFIKPELLEVFQYRLTILGREFFELVKSAISSVG